MPAFCMDCYPSHKSLAVVSDCKVSCCFSPGDDMGLGKTMQCAAFMSGMVKSKLARCGIWALSPASCNFEHHHGRCANQAAALSMCTSKADACFNNAEAPEIEAIPAIFLIQEGSCGSPKDAAGPLAGRAASVWTGAAHLRVLWLQRQVHFSKPHRLSTHTMSFILCDTVHVQRLQER